MAELGPWDPVRRIAVAVSGGPDSLCLALLSHTWGQATAFIVDHGLRPGSAAEALWTVGALHAHGMPAQIITLSHLHPGPGLAARAREARYAALTAACQQAGLVDLLLGHHAADQAETILMRRRRGSGPAGLAGMAAIVDGHATRLLRPLLRIPPARLKATLDHHGQSWIEDPSNHDPRATRTRLRAELAATPGAPQQPHATNRTAAETAAAAELAHRAAIHSAGWALLSPGPLSGIALGMLLRAIGGHPYTPSPGPLASLAAALRPATLAGVRVLPAGRLGPGWLLVREPAAVAPPSILAAGITWDRRFRITGEPQGAFTIAALGDEAAQFRSTFRWPACILRPLPAIRRNNVLSAVPHLAYAHYTTGLEHVRIRHAGPPVCGAAFVAI